MSRTLHVIDQPGDAAEAVVLRLSVDAARLETQCDRDQHAWLLFGGEATRDAARAVGLRDDLYRLLPKPAGLHRLMPAGLAAPKRLMGHANRVVCWTEGASQIASLLGCAHVVRRIADATLCHFSQSMIMQANADVASQASDRDALREQWGIDVDTTVVALLGDRVDRIDASAALMAVVLTHEALRASQPDHAEVRLLCHPLTRRRADAALFGELLSLDRLLIQDAQVGMPWSVLAGCDAALAPIPTEAGLSILWADAMKVPVVTPSDRLLPLLDELEHIFPSRSSKPKELADALTNWAQSQSPQTILR